MEKQRVSIPVLSAASWDTTEVCLNLEAGFITQLLGLAQILKLYRMWDGTDEQIEAVMPQVEKGIQQLMGCGCFEGVMSTKITKGGYVKVTYTDGSEEMIQSSYSEDDIQKFPEEQATDNDLNNICAGSRLLVERLFDEILFSLDQADYVIDETKVVSEGLSAILNTIPFAGQTVGIAFDGWEEWVTSVAELGVSTLKLAFSDPAVHAKMTENLYCGVVATGSNQMTKAIYEAATDDLPLLESQSTILAELFKGLQSTVSDEAYEKALRWYNLGALNEDNTCAAEYSCPVDPNIVTFDVSTNTVPYTVDIGSIAVDNGTNALLKTGAPNNGTSGHRIQFTANFPVPTYIEHLVLNVRARTGGQPLGTARTIGVTVTGDGVGIGGSNQLRTETNDFLNFEMDVTPGSYTNVVVRVDTGTAVGQTQTLVCDNILFEGL